MNAASSVDPTTKRILDAAAEQFVLFGIRRSSVGGIARRANLGRTGRIRPDDGDAREFARRCIAPLLVAAPHASNSPMLGSNA